MHHFFSAPMMLDLAASDQFFNNLASAARMDQSGQLTDPEFFAAGPAGNGSNQPAMPQAFLNQELARREREADSEFPFPVVDGEAFLNLSGVIGKQLPWYARYYGMTDLNEFQAQLKIVEENDAIDRWRVTGHTPGGSVIGIIETMRQVKAIAKPSIFQSDTYFNSGGYFIASAFDRVEATASCRVGSIGVIMGLYDRSGMIQGEMKIKPVVIRSGANKAPGYLMGEKITSEQIARFTEDVESLFERHDGLLQSYRPTITPEVKDGRVISGEDAYMVGLIDDEVQEIKRPAEFDFS